MMHTLGLPKDLRAPVIAGTLVFIATLIAWAPASLISLAAPDGPHALAYSDARGTIWRGALGGASVAGVSLGDVSFQLSPLSLLGLSPEVRLSAKGGAITGDGRISIASGMRVKLSDVTADISLGAVAPRGVFGAPANGRATIAITSLVFSKRAGCREASGDLWTDVLDAPAKRFNLPALPIAGDMHCDGDALVIALKGENDRTGADVTLRLNKSLTYEISAMARPSEESIASALRVFGFEDDNGALIYGSAGVLTGAGS